MLRVGQGTYRGFETHAGTAGRGTRGRGAWRGRGGYRGRGRGRGGDAWGTHGGDVGDAWPESEAGEWPMSMDWDGESFDGEGEWPANSSMEYDPWGGGAPMMSGSDASMHPVGNNGGGHDQRTEGYQRSRSHERDRELDRRSPPRERSRERTPPPRPDWKRHQRPPEHDYSTTIDLMYVHPTHIVCCGHSSYRSFVSSALRGALPRIVIIILLLLALRAAICGSSRDFGVSVVNQVLYAAPGNHARAPLQDIH
jgi:hypothetical protein